jgi:hypothetical protein
MMIGWMLAAAVIVALLAIGIGGVMAPRSASRQYGVVLDDPRALGIIRAMAARDFVIGVLLGMVAVEATRNTVACAMVVTAFIAAVDLRIVMADRVATSRPRLDRATALHASGAVGLLITGAVLVAGY